jgi:transcriptional regulator GlxA family with amidase domain
VPPFRRSAASVSSAGVSAGTDLGFYLVSRLAGRAVAEIAAKAAEYDWRRDPNQPILYPEQPIIPNTFERSATSGRPSGPGV